MSDIKLDNEKGAYDTKHLESDSPGLESLYSDISNDEVYSPQEQRRIIHRVDRRLVTTCGFMYCISLMDRTNLPNAAIAGMTKQLRLDIGFRYSIIVLLFFVPYVIFQPPATVLVRKIGPRPFLATITVGWGATMIGFGFVKKWNTIAGLRVLLGVFEAGFFPGCVYLLSTWYSRYDVGKRYSIFYLIGSFASAASGILAFGLMQMSGLANLGGWSWIFIMEGIITCLVGIGGYFSLVDFPEQAATSSWKFLNHQECQFIIRRVNRDRGDALPESFTLQRFLTPALDLKIWGFALIFFCVTTVTYSIAYFLPIILRENMGFSLGASQCLIAPPYGFAGILMFLTAYVGDRFHIRGPILVFNAIVALVGLPIMGFAEKNAARYFGVFLVTGGANANIPAAMAYQANNIRGQWKRALCSATLVGMGGVGGIAGGLVFRSQDAPKYRPGIWAAIACNLLIIVIVGMETVYFLWANRRAKRVGKLVEGCEGFRYTI
ncbi:MAG: hypothetical protein Q9214_000265 [Letrouitia sp. 1 TL-2023]